MTYVVFAIKEGALNGRGELALAQALGISLADIELMGNATDEVVEGGF